MFPTRKALLDSLKDFSVMLSQGVSQSSHSPYPVFTREGEECNGPTDFPSSDTSLTGHFNNSHQEVFTDVKSVLLDLAVGRSIGPYRCRHWKNFHLRLIRSHRLAPWLYCTISQQPHVYLNKDIIESLRKDLYQEMIVDIFREAQIKSILDAARETDINLVFLKGAYLAYWVYENPALRMMNDVDFLVHPNDLQRTKDLFTNLGYTNNQLPPLGNLPDPSYMFFSEDLDAPSIDLHWQLRSMDYYYIPNELIWNEVAELSLFGTNVHVMSPELNFVHLALHTLNHHYLLRNWIDMVLLLLRPGFDWDRLLRLSDLAGVQRPLFLALSELKGEWNITPPLFVSNQLADYRPHWLEDRVIGSQYNSFWRFVSRVRQLPGISDKVQYFFSVIFPNRAYMEHAWGTLSRTEYINSGIRKLLTRQCTSQNPAQNSLRRRRPSTHRMNIFSHR